MIRLPPVPLKRSLAAILANIPATWADLVGMSVAHMPSGSNYRKQMKA